LGGRRVDSLFFRHSRGPPKFFLSPQTGRQVARCSSFSDLEGFLDRSRDFMCGRPSEHDAIPLFLVASMFLDMETSVSLDSKNERPPFLAVSPDTFPTIAFFSLRKLLFSPPDPNSSVLRFISTRIRAFRHSDTF